MNPTNLSWEDVSAAVPEFASEERYADELARLLVRVLCNYVNPPLRRKYFTLWQEHGFHLTPVSYYEPIPDTRDLTHDLWEQNSKLVGIEMNESTQLHLLREFTQLRDEYDLFPAEPTAKPYGFHFNNGMFDGTDALVLYCMVRYFQPTTILEVGSGFSSRISAHAALLNARTELVCIEPYPDGTLSTGFPGLTTLISKKVQEIDLHYFEKLGPGDILFIDSSHVAKIGSDVNYLFLEIIPRLKPGVIVHIHDIFFPMEYSRDWVVEKLRFWNEQYLLQAFLSFNPTYGILLCNHYLGHAHLDEMRATFPNSPWWGGGSLWMRRKAE